MVSASTRLPASTRAAARGVVSSSSSSSSTPRARRSSARSARELVVLLVTNRRRWPSSRSRRTASPTPSIGRPETWKTPSTSRRMAAMERESIRVTRSVTIPLSEIDAPVLALERAGRAARPEVGDPRGGDLRRRGLRVADRPPEAARPAESRRRCCARSPRTSAARPETESSRSGGSRTRCARPSTSSGRGGRRSRAGPQSSAASSRSAAGHRRNACVSRRATESGRSRPGPSRRRGARRPDRRASASGWSNPLANFVTRVARPPGPSGSASSVRPCAVLRYSPQRATNRSPRQNASPSADECGSR